jgi:hypothetical protein
LEQDFSKKERNKLLIGIVAATVLNVFFALVFVKPNSVAHHLDGNLATKSEITLAKLGTFLFRIPVMGFLLGTIGSLFPYKDLPYGKKYLRASLISILILHCIFLCLGVFILLVYR